MLEGRINKNLEKAYNNSIEENKFLRKTLSNYIENFIMTINQIQDVQAIGISEAEKNIMRNSIINKKRTEFVTKIIELDGPAKSSNSN